MPKSHLSQVNILDEKRYSRGNTYLKDFFNGLADSHPEEALRVINQNNLDFTSLYVLENDLNIKNLTNELSLRNTIALDIKSEILDKEHKLSNVHLSSCESIQVIHDALKWIVTTGVKDDGLDDNYDQILDGAIALLTKVYKDTSILSTAVDLIFSRNRKGLFIHDLVWAFFEARDPSSLILIANRLQSTERETVELAQKLLSFVPGMDSDTTNQENQYLSFLNWIEENRSFLYFTGESFQQRPDPIPYAIAWDAKYLHRPISMDTGKPLKVLTSKEVNHIEVFHQLSEVDKVCLSSYSFKLHQENPRQWQTWINYPIPEEIKIAKNRMEGYDD